MITKNPMQLKAYIKEKAAEKHISAQLVMQNYMLERLLERISLSPYKHNFIIKGGFLVSAIVGLDTRATMDLDTTIKGFTLTHEAMWNIHNNLPDWNDLSFFRLWQYSIFFLALSAACDYTSAHHNQHSKSFRSEH